MGRLVEVTGGLVLGAASGLLLALLAGLVLRARPRTRVAWLFAAFAGGLGLALALRAGGGTVDIAGATREAWEQALLAGTLGAALVSSLALVALALHVPRPLPRRDRWMLVPAGLLAALVGGLRAMFHLGLAPPAPGTSTLVSLILPAWSFALLLLALRFPGEPRGGQVAVVSIALLAWVGAIAGFALGGLLRGAHPAVLASTLATAVVAGVWLAQMARARDAQERRKARRVALAALSLVLLGFASFLALGGAVPAVTAGVVGALNVASGALLAYAILRHRLLGLDVKVKWTVKQSTVAAAFVGVFFVVSESASSFLATEGGLGTYLGIAAAGLLVFAMAPLQRAAERVASAAMPGVKAPAEMTVDERLALYREQVRIAWSDGQLSADERRLLAGTRATLRISPEEALRIEQEVVP